jgi:hypothetical protein
VEKSVAVVADGRILVKELLLKPARSRRPYPDEFTPRTVRELIEVLEAIPDDATWTVHHGGYNKGPYLRFHPKGWPNGTG